MAPRALSVLELRAKSANYSRQITQESLSAELAGLRLRKFGVYPHEHE